MTSNIRLLKVKYLPNELEHGILYFSKKYGIAGHLCPCGCGNKIITPIGPAEWSITIKSRLPSLYPSIGNWQLPCRSHYWIKNGKIKWSYQMSEDEIIAGQKVEDYKRISYYRKLEDKQKNQSIFRYLIRKWFY